MIPLRKRRAATAPGRVSTAEQTCSRQLKKDAMGVKSLGAEQYLQPRFRTVTFSNSSIFSSACVQVFDLFM